MTRIVCVSDTQTPFEDKRAVDAVAAFIDDYKPDTVISAGDDADFAQISRYSQGNAGEHAGDMGKDRDRTVEVLRMLQVKHVTRSNHLDRWYAALARVPGLMKVDEFKLENFLRFPELGITYHDKPWDPTGTGTWLLMHGDEGALSSIAGSSAAALAKRTGRSVICGHSHRLGLQPFTHTFLGDKRPRILWGFEAGTLADFNSPGMRYAKFKNWQQGFGILHVNHGTVTPQAVPIINKSFIVDGVRYAW